MEDRSFLYVLRVLFYDPSMSPLERVRSELAGLVNGALPPRGGMLVLISAARSAGISAAVAKGLGMRFVGSLSSFAPSAEFLNAVPIAFARQHRILGLMGENDQLLLALGDPAGLEQVQVVSRFLGRAVTPVMAASDVVL